MKQTAFRLIDFGSIGVLALLVWLLGIGASKGRAAEVEDRYAERLKAASNAGEEAIRKFQIPEGCRVELFAAEPLVANPVAFTIDEKGRFFVAETFRLHQGVTDTRRHMYWVVDDLACRTVADRVEKYRRFLGDQFETYGQDEDRVRLVEDTSGDGRADRATVFASGFRDYPDGIGAGLLARKGDVWFACIPDLWLLRDLNGNGQADVIRSLQTGYGVHTGFLGHDLHGLRKGPDGRIYFSIGDRGLSVQQGSRRIDLPDTGAVLRCNPDGTDLEIFHFGLRNPQEIAFDEWGNWFTCDNNCDSGDKARWVHLVPGGDTGWRISYQFHDKPMQRGPWNSEKLWHLPHEQQPAYIVPPIAHVADGPSGLVYHPGTAFGGEWAGTFFLADFRGSAVNSGIRAIRLEPDGASFKVTRNDKFLWSILATDVDFGYDGAMYVSDWIDGWDQPLSGRIYRMNNKAPATEAIAALFRDGFEQLPLERLGALLAHPDQRVRLEAQWTLAERGRPAEPIFAEAALRSTDRLARVHGIWGLGQLGRIRPSVLEPLLPLLADSDPEIRTQTARVLGESRFADWLVHLLPLVADDSPRVAGQAAHALAELRHAGPDPRVIDALFAAAERNADRDAYLRHALVMALASHASEEQLANESSHKSRARRMAAVLALRRQNSPALARFLADEDPLVRTETVRAIYDEPGNPALAALASLVGSEAMREDVLARRIISAYWRTLADPSVTIQRNVEARTRELGELLDRAVDAELPVPIRVEILQSVVDLAAEGRLDRVTGLFRPYPPLPADLIRRSLEDRAERLLRADHSLVRIEVARALGHYGAKSADGLLLDRVDDPEEASRVRTASLLALEAMGSPRLQETVQKALVAKDEPALRSEAQRILASLDAAKSVDVLANAIATGTLEERQKAIATLAGVATPEADAVLRDWLEKLGRRVERSAENPQSSAEDLAKDELAEIELDLLEAARRRAEVAEIAQWIERRRSSQPGDDPLAEYRACLVGGNVEAGSTVFYEKTAVGCLRCHKIGDKGGEVGPELTGIGAKQSRHYLLESIVEPDKQIAKGFETIVVLTDEGETVVGVLKGETDTVLTLITPEAKIIEIPKDSIEERRGGPSSMPRDLINQLSKQEIRDLVEFLSSLR